VLGHQLCGDGTAGPLVESDKASMEIPLSHGGVVKGLNVKLGDKVKEGSLVLVLEAAGANVAPISE
jgi:pyruvate/2-oxoglutarate dehydrogenase complex dihydrolipoamide acyltransferase (E2) component